MIPFLRIITNILILILSIFIFFSSEALCAEKQPIAKMPSFITSLKRHIIIASKDQSNIQVMEVYVLFSRSDIENTAKDELINFPLPATALHPQNVQGFKKDVAYIKNNFIIHNGSIHTGQNLFGFSYVISIDNRPARFSPAKIYPPYPIDILISKDIFNIEVMGGNRLPDETLSIEISTQSFEHYIGHVGLEGAPELVVIFKQEKLLPIGLVTLIISVFCVCMVVLFFIGKYRNNIKIKNEEQIKTIKALNSQDLLDQLSDLELLKEEGKIEDQAFLERYEILMDRLKTLEEKRG